MPLSREAHNPSVFQVNDLVAMAEAGDPLVSRDRAAAALGYLMLDLQSQRVAARSDPEVVQLQGEFDTYVSVGAGAVRASVPGTSNLFSAMVQLTRHLVGPVQMVGNTGWREVGLFARLDSENVPPNHTVLDESGAPAQGWQIAEIERYRPGQSAMDSKYGWRVAPDRFGLMIRDNGIPMEYSLTDGEGSPRYEAALARHGQYMTRRGIPYDPNSQLPPSFLFVPKMAPQTRRETLSDWNSRLYNGVAHLALEAARRTYRRGALIATPPPPWIP